MYYFHIHSTCATQDVLVFMPLVRLGGAGLEWAESVSCTDGAKGS